MDSRFEIETRDSVFMRIWAASLFILFGLTWKLWLPGFTEFPRVPVFGSLGAEVLLPCHYLATAALMAGLVGTISGMGLLRRWLGLMALGLAVLFICNQHCLQPWAWQAFIMATLLAILPTCESKKWIGWLLISIYLFSAAGKFDYQFVHTVGGYFMSAILNWLGLNSLMGTQTRTWLVLIFPVGEALIALGLTLRETRRVAAWLAIALHAVLFFLLSRGLGQMPPVIVWNGVSIVLVVWLFLPNRVAESRTVAEPVNFPLCRVARVFALVVLLGPLLRPAELWDHWLAWGLYSPSNSRVEVHVPETALPRVDKKLEPYFLEEEQYGVRRFAIEHWSLEELGVPIYPQARFQKVVAAKSLRQQDLTAFSEVIEYSAAHPVTGVRSKSKIDLEK